jgi:hypothetical protein
VNLRRDLFANLNAILGHFVLPIGLFRFEEASKAVDRHVVSVRQNNVLKTVIEALQSASARGSMGRSSISRPSFG